MEATTQLPTQITFEQVPAAITELLFRIGNIQQILTEKSQAPTAEPDKLLLIHEAAEFLTLSVPTIYSKVSKSEIPFMKKGKRLYFSKSELTSWLMTGHNKTSADIEADTDNFLQTRKRKRQLA